ncbi:hypothetical protein K466DRAFT_234060 [Polyporus arcularius HHB13444]|uniref:Uncharacterized protein n=1 Tax=Polyporus arcularius HHB13444 TaxID=1314778 RepID=A0A5C3P3X5_9APHY|nr:hypothetical protein K466DRAFT_234060 [Polyporus arcularius HHB13444]
MSFPKPTVIAQIASSMSSCNSKLAASAYPRAAAVSRYTQGITRGPATCHGGVRGAAV